MTKEGMMDRINSKLDEIDELFRKGKPEDNPRLKILLTQLEILVDLYKSCFNK